MIIEGHQKAQATNCLVLKMFWGQSVQMRLVFVWRHNTIWPTTYNNGRARDSVFFIDFSSFHTCKHVKAIREYALYGRHNGRDGVSNHQHHNCLLKCFFRRRSRKHQSSASLAFVWGIRRWPVNSPHKWPVTRKMFPFDDVVGACRV